MARVCKVTLPISLFHPLFLYFLTRTLTQRHNGLEEYNERKASQHFPFLDYSKSIANAYLNKLVEDIDAHFYAIISDETEEVGFSVRYFTYFVIFIANFNCLSLQAQVIYGRAWLSIHVIGPQRLY